MMIEESKNEFNYMKNNVLRIGLVLLISLVFPYTVRSSMGGVLPQTNWRLWYVDSEETVGENGVVENAFDGSANTIWHTQWLGGNPPPPHEIQIDLGGNYNIDGFRYLPRQTGYVDPGGVLVLNGAIRNYEFYVSVDGINWGSPVASGAFANANTTAVKEVLFNAKSGRFVRLRAMSEVNGNPWTSVAELNVLGNGTAFGGYYVAVGDSITLAAGDDILADGKGYEPVLGNLLFNDPNTIANAGVDGTTSADGAASISTTLSNYPSAQYYLIMYGTNDSSTTRGPGYPFPKATYKANMQAIITAIKNAGKIPYLAKVPYVDSSNPNFPAGENFSDVSIQQYNQAISELVLANGIPVTPPDFYAWFQSNTSQLQDGIHPTGVGYQSMANLWFGALP